MDKRIFQCSDCTHKWEVLYGTPRPNNCPECNSTNIHRAEEDRGYSRKRETGIGRIRRQGQNYRRNWN